MSIAPDASGEHPEPVPPSPVSPTIILVVATAFSVVTGYFTDWETAVTVFTAIISLFTGKRDN